MFASNNRRIQSTGIRSERIRTNARIWPSYPEIAEKNTKWKEETCRQSRNQILELLPRDLIIKCISPLKKANEAK